MSNHLKESLQQAKEALDVLQVTLEQKNNAINLALATIQSAKLDEGVDPKKVQKAIFNINKLLSDSNNGKDIQDSVNKAIKETKKDFNLK